MVHGWLARGDDNNETIKRDIEKAISIIQEFFIEVLAD